MDRGRWATDVAGPSPIVPAKEEICPGTGAAVAVATPIAEIDPKVQATSIATVRALVLRFRRFMVEVSARRPADMRRTIYLANSIDQARGSGAQLGIEPRRLSREVV